MPIVQQRRGTKAELDASTEIFAAGQILFETDTVNIKVGDGLREYAQLPYLSIATGAVGNDQLAADSVDSVVLQDNSVFTASIQNAAVTADKLAEQSVTSAAIVNNAVVEEKIADNAVTSNKIPTDAITTAKIAGDSVTGAEIAPSAVSSTELAAGAVLETHVSSFAISTDKLGAFSVTDTKLAADAVTTVKVEDNAITYAKIQDVSSGDTVLGRSASSPGQIQEIACTQFARDLLAESNATGVRTAISAVHQNDIDAAIANLVDSAPSTLDTLKELSDALGDDANFSTTVTNSIATKMSLSGGTFTGDINIGQSSVGGAVDIILPRQSSTTKHQIRFLHNNTEGFSNPPNELDFIRLYQDSLNHAGLGISSGFFNIGTKGSISFSIYTNGVARTVYNHDGTATHTGQHNFSGVIDTTQYIRANGYRAKNAGTATSTAYGRFSDADTGAYFPSDDEYAIATDGETRMKFRDLSAGSTNKQSDIVVQRSPGRATFKAGTNLDSSGWFIIDSSGSPVALNYWTSNNVSLCHGGGGVTVGTNANPGQYKLYVNGKGYFQNDVKIGSAGQLILPDGDAADPAICFASDTNTGIKRNTNGNLDIVTNGVNRISVTTGGDIHTSSAGTVYLNSNVTVGGTVTITNGMDVSNLAQSGANTSNLLKWTGAEWAGATISLNDNTDVTAFPSTGEVLYYNGTNWQGAAPSSFLATAYLGDLSNVSSTAASTGEVLTWNGTSWAPATPTGGTGGTGSSTLAGLTDVTVSSATSGEVLYWNGSGWVNQDLGLHAVATSGSYNDLANKPAYATVATTGSYNDLTNVPSTFAPSAHTHPISAVTALQSTLNNKENVGHTHAQSEITNLVTDLAGKASLVGGKVPSSELPSFVDDVLEYSGTSSFPASGETGKIYVDTSTNKTHRWTGSVYVEISASPGSTDSVTEGSTNLYYTNARVDSRILNSLLDEDDFASNSDQAAPTQQSVKTYADNINSTLVGMIASANVNIGTNASTIAQKADTSSLSTVATSGSYNDLSNVPTTFAPSSHTHAQSQITGLVSALAAKAETSSLATVATSGLYSDITGRVQSINDLSNVSSSSPNAGDILRYDGTNWVEENPELISTITTTTSNRAISLNYSNAQSFVVNMQSSALHTVSFANWPTTSPLRVLTATMIMKFPGTGGAATTATVSWPSSVKWPGGTAPTITNKAGATDVFSFVSYDNGTSWLGFTGGQEF